MIDLCDFLKCCFYNFSKAYDISIGIIKKTAKLSLNMW